jgi:hypothetical protein
MTLRSFNALILPQPNQRVLLALAGLLLALTLAGCATLSHEECVRGNWYQIGVNDGQQGHVLSRLDDHRRACRDTPAIIDEGAYRAGRDIGLLSYCTPVSGYRVGERGRSAPNVCPAETAPGFLHGHLLGEQVYDAEQEVAEAEQRLRNLERRLRDTQEEIDAAQQRVDAADNRDARRSARQNLWVLRNEADDVRADIRDAQFNVDITRQTLRDVRERTSFQLQVLADG